MSVNLNRRGAAAWLGISVALAGCSVDRHYTVRDASTDLVGLSKADLYLCAGVPDRTAMINGVEFDTFHNSEEISSSLTIPLIGGGAATQDTQFCNTTAALVGDKVQAISFAGDTGAFYARDEQCSYSIKTCVRLVEDRRKQQQSKAPPAP